MKVTTSIEKITPEKAAQYLGNNHARQRNVTNSHMLYLAQQMENGQWWMNGEPVIFNENEDVLDGQHRLLAVIKSGVTIESLVVRGVPAPAFPSINGGKPRSKGNNFAIHGVENFNVAASATGGVLNYRRALKVPAKKNGEIVSYGGSLNSTIRPSSFDVIEEYEAHPDDYKIAIKIAMRCKKQAPGAATSTVAALALIDGSMGRHAVEEFWDMFYSGVGMESVHDPVLRLRDRMYKNAASDAKMSTSQIILLMVRAWNLWADEKECRVLRVNTDKAVPVR